MPNFGFYPFELCAIGRLPVVVVVVAVTADIVLVAEAGPGRLYL